MEKRLKPLVKRMIEILSVFAVAMALTSYAIFKTIEKSRQPSPERLKELQHHKTGGFTLVELLVTLSIISVLSTLAMANFNIVRQKVRDDNRIANIKLLQVALEAYKSDNGTYPKTFELTDPQPEPPYYNVPSYAYCPGWSGEWHPDDYIPGLVPKYILKLPGDPLNDCASFYHGWFYMSNGVDYKLITHNEDLLRYKEYSDPRWEDGTHDFCIVDSNEVWHFAIYTPGAACWSPE